MSAMFLPMLSFLLVIVMFQRSTSIEIDGGIVQCKPDLNYNECRDECKSLWKKKFPKEDCKNCDKPSCQASMRLRCVMTGCGKPPVIPKTSVLGNVFTFGSTLTYKCLSKYEMTKYSQSQISCQRNSTWTKAKLRCELNCTTAAPTNGAVTSTTVVHGQSTTYSCTTSGYSLIGIATQTCTSGSLSAAIPTCEKDCTAAAPMNGAVNSTTVVHGQSTTYSCTTSGYSLIGIATQTCTSGSLSAAIPTCERDCTAAAPTNGSVTSTTVLHGQSTTYSCTTSGYTLIGTATQTCTSGLLSAAIPACEKDCTAAAPTNGAVTSTTVVHGQTTTYSCTTSGYSLIGIATQTCTSGLLSAAIPTCEKQDCMAAAPTHGAVTSTTVVHGQSTTYSCTTSGYSLIGTATQTCTSGSLSAAVPTCEQDCTAAAPTNGAVASSTVVHGQSSTYSCTTSGYSLIGTDTQTCTSGSLSAAIPTCEQDCTAAAPTNGAVTSTTVVHGQSTIYSCTTSGYTLIGTATRTCTSGSLSATDPTCEQGWTVFQKRFDGSLDFYRTFKEYEDGFGDVNAEFWMGLKHIHKMTFDNGAVLRIDLTAADGTTAFETYQDFHVSPGPDYTLHVGQAAGTAGDSYGLTWNNGYGFSTKDKDVDGSGADCAEGYHGGWWYSRICAYTNLNGDYATPGTLSSYNGGYGGVVYYGFKQTQSLKTSTMMFRRT